MADTSHPLDRCAAEIGSAVEQLFTPLTRFKPQKPDQHFAIDNGAFSHFDAAGFSGLLSREYPRRHLCRFVAVPDVPGSARRTLETFAHWAPIMTDWPRALVCQDGQEAEPIPWTSVAAIFIGGTTEWKLSRHAEQCIKAAKILGKWVHIGRVNTPGRWEHFERLGADSIDGTGLSRFADMRDKIYRRRVEPQLFPETHINE